MSILNIISRKVREFVSDQRGVAGIEFLSTCPLLFGVMIFTSEYGQALRVRTTLDAAVHDAARFLARTNAPSSQTGVASDLFQERKNEALAIIENRTGREVISGGAGQPAFDVSLQTVNVGQFRTSYQIVQVTATIQMDMPLLSFLDIWAAPGNRLHDGGKADEDRFATALLMTATTQARYLASSPPGATPCSFANRAQELC